MTSYNVTAASLPHHGGSGSIPSKSSGNSPAVAGGTLPRDVHIWLQSLGLSSAVKHPRRDLANGLVIAQICSHYWPHVPLHSLGNGTSTSSKQSNWYVLQKVMRRHSVEVSAAMVHGMVTGSGDCAVEFLKQLYSIFTGRAVEERPVAPAEPLVAVPSSDVPLLTPTTASMRGRSPTSTAASATAATAATGKSSSFASPSTSAALNSLPPIVPPQPANATFAAAAVATGKPALAVSVRAAGQLSTVMAAPQPTDTDGTAGGEGEVGPKAAAAARRAFARGTSPATLWCVARVRAALPAEAVEAVLAEGDGGGSATPLQRLLNWLAAGDGGDDRSSSSSSGSSDTNAHSSKKRNHQADGVAAESATTAGQSGGQESKLRRGVWDSLSSSVRDLAELVLAQSSHGLDLLVDSLFVTVVAQPRCASRTAFARRALRLCAALLAQVGEADCHLAVRCFHAYWVTSDAFAHAVAQMEWDVAESYAELLASVLPRNLVPASAVLESVWAALEAVARDTVADHAAGEAERVEASLVCFARALLRLLVPLERSAAASVAARPRSGAASATAAASRRGVHDGTRTPIGSATRAALRARGGVYGTATAGSGASSGLSARVEAGAFDTLVIRAAQQRCHAALLLLLRTSRRGEGGEEAPLSRLLAAAAAALAVDLLRVDVSSNGASTLTEAVSGDGFFTTFDALFSSPAATTPQPGSSSGTEAWRLHTPESAADAAHEGEKETDETAPTLSEPAALTVLRARWLRWCLQRRWQLGLSQRRPASPWQSPHPSPVSLASSITTTTTAAPGGDREAPPLSQHGSAQAWADTEEMRALAGGLQRLCAELQRSSSHHGGSHGTDTDQPQQVQRARVLAAAALTEALPYLPTKFRGDDRLPQHGCADNGSQREEHEEEGNDQREDRGAQLLEVQEVKSSSSSNNRDRTRAASANAGGQLPQHQQQGRASQQVSAEATAEAAMRALMCAATPQQLRELLLSPSSCASAAAAPRSVRFSEGASDQHSHNHHHHHPQQQQQSEDTTAHTLTGNECAKAGQSLAVVSPFVGALVPTGPLVLRSDALLLTKAMLSVLESDAATARATERDTPTVARRLGTRAALMSREGSVGAALEARVSWLHALLVEGRATAAAASAAATTATTVAEPTEAAAPLLPLTAVANPSSVGPDGGTRGSRVVVRDEAVVAQWHAVVMECWDTLMVVLQAATLRLRQRSSGGSAAATAASSSPAEAAAAAKEAVGTQLFTCAQKAQAVVCCLCQELSAALPDKNAAAAAAAAVVDTASSSTSGGRGDGVTLSSALLSGPLASFVPEVPAEEVQAAVLWMWSVVAAAG